MNAAGEPMRGEPGSFSLLASMTRTRLELAAIEIEAHIAATVSAIATGIVALNSSPPQRALSPGCRARGMSPTWSGP